MDFWHQASSESSTLIGRTGIPKRVLAHFLSATKIGVGYSVLDVGCGRGELAAYLDSLGIRSSGIDESPKNVMEARCRVSTCEFHCASVGDPLPSLHTQFDVVLVRDSSVFQGSMLSRPAFLATLQLLSLVRAGGCLAFIERTPTRKPAAAGHQFSCYARHIRSLPGEHDLQEFPDGPVFARPIRSWTSQRAAPGYGIAILRLALQPPGRAEWSTAIDKAVETSHGACCYWAAQAGEPRHARSKAA